MANLKPVQRVAAKAVITNSRGHVLIVREASTDRDNVKVGQWGLPGGRVHSGEPFGDALKRETHQETGLKVTPIKPLHVGEWWPVIREVPYQIIGVFILCHMESP